MLLFYGHDQEDVFRMVLMIQKSIATKKIIVDTNNKITISVTQEINYVLGACS